VPRAHPSVPQTRVALIGAGLVGAGWAIVFARAGLEVVVYDEQAAQRQRLPGWVSRQLSDLQAEGLLHEPPAVIAARIRLVSSLEAALEGVDFVQESIVERLEVKQRLYAAMDALAAPGTILASSTSAFPTSAIAEGLAGRARCIVAHPVNPPYLVPLVEVSGAPFTAPATVERTLALMRAVGQAPIHVRREIHGFVLNRLQWTLLAEACRLVEAGIASIDDVDAAIRDGLGRRWAFIGPFEVGDLNAPAGLGDYLQRFAPTIEAINAPSAEGPFQLHPGNVAALHAARRELLPEAQREARMAWRDRRLMALAAHLATAARQQTDEDSPGATRSMPPT